MADIIQTMGAAKARKLQLSRLVCNASGTHLIALEGPEKGSVYVGHGRSSEQALWNALKAEYAMRRPEVNHAT